MEKKTKLTISGNPKKSIKNFNDSSSSGKKTTIIEKQASKHTNKRNFGSKSTSASFKKGLTSKTNFTNKVPQSSASDFERRKLAEQRATKRLKAEVDNKDKKSKIGTKKRELKLTVSRALSDEIESRERSLASIKRARQKELKNSNKNENNQNLKSIKRDINVSFNRF